jgi:hypothetical protein
MASSRKYSKLCGRQSQVERSFKSSTSSLRRTVAALTAEQMLATCRRLAPAPNSDPRATAILDYHFIHVFMFNRLTNASAKPWFHGHVLGPLFFAISLSGIDQHMRTEGCVLARLVHKMTQLVESARVIGKFLDSHGLALFCFLGLTVASSVSAAAYCGHLIHLEYEQKRMELRNEHKKKMEKIRDMAEGGEVHQLQKAERRAAQARAGRSGFTVEHRRFQGRVGLVGNEAKMTRVCLANAFWLWTMCLILMHFCLTFSDYPNLKYVNTFFQHENHCSLASSPLLCDSESAGYILVAK